MNNLLRKSEIEKIILAQKMNLLGIGLRISELTVIDNAVIKELEKKDTDRALKQPRKPLFVSAANYKGLRLAPNQIGTIFGIKIVKSEK